MAMYFISFNFHLAANNDHSLSYINAEYSTQLNNDLTSFPRPSKWSIQSPSTSGVRSPKPSSSYPIPLLPFTILTNAANSSEIIPKLKAKLLEASSIYSKDKETLSWFVMQSVHDPRDFTIIERYESEDSQKYHLANPYWKTFDPAVLPMLEEIKGGNVNGGKMDLRRNEELVE